MIIWEKLTPKIEYFCYIILHIYIYIYIYIYIKKTFNPSQSRVVIKSFCLKCMIIRRDQFSCCKGQDSTVLLAGGGLLYFMTLINSST